MVYKKGYTAVTMTDISEKCQLSIGGLYYHYRSVEEILIDIVNIEKYDHWEALEPAHSFEELIEWLEQFFKHEKIDILNFENTVNAIMYQYFFSFPVVERRQKLKTVYDRTCQIIESRISPFVTDKKQITLLCNHLFVLFEGLNMTAMSGQIMPELIDFEFIRFTEMFKEAYHRERL